MKTKERNQRFFYPSIFSKSRKGLLLAEETLKIIVAVIVIGFLVYFLASLYFSNKESEDLKFAEASLQKLVEQMNLQSQEAEIFNPEGWIITSWSQTKGRMPLQCSNLGWKNCVCLCENDYNYDVLGIKNDDLDDCNQESYCLEYGKEIIIKGEVIEVDNPPISLQINYGDKIEVNKK